jgi:anthranilate/para-aminobenzoate synthase component I
MQVDTEIKVSKLAADPARVFLRVRRRARASFLLESAEKGRSGRYSIVGWDPLLYFRDDGAEGDPLQRMKKELGLDTLEFRHELPPYVAGVFGYIGYDYVRRLHTLENRARDDLHHPVIEFFLPRNLLVFDHYSNQVIRCRHRLESVGSPPPARGKPRTGRPSRVTCNMTRRSFEVAVERAKEYIRRGDIIQVVLSRRISLSPCPSLEAFYLRLRKINPSPYMYFLDLPGKAIVGSSPEMLVQVSGRKVLTRPIAGTRRRGKTDKEDRELEEELSRDEKERAEHVMLVDLARNDLGRVCNFGSVRVGEFMRIEKYSHVQHLVSDVTGELQAGKDVFDVIRATFPAGTVTGAPKFRAMEIIEELEPTRRGIYAGGVGFIGYRGELNLAITIRTLVAQDSGAHLQVGAGVVADSVPWKEYLETKNKAAALLEAAGVRV